MPITRRAAATATLVVCLAITATACGGDDGAAAKPTGAAAPTTTPSPTERLESMTGVIVLETARAEFRKVASVTMTGFAVKDGLRATFTVSADRSGNCAATTIQEGQGPSQAVGVQGETFIRLDPQSFADSWGAATAEKFRGRWFRMPRGQALDDVAGFCDLARVPIVGAAEADEQAISDGVRSVRGRRSVGVSFTSPETPPFLGYIAAEGPPRPVRVKSQAEDFQVDFTDYDKPVTVTAPPADQIVDVAALLEHAP
ncbi:hypothetical protein ACWEQL_31705 [Kitasatospora sp. NPDC004240]